MAIVNWLGQEAALSAAAMTVRAQAASPTDQDRLTWDQLFPRVNVDSVDLTNIFVTDYRPTADRREWDARGRRIPLVTPSTRPVSIVPIESNFQIGELEMQRLEERAFGNRDVFRALVGASLPARVDSLASANYRRLEADAMQAYANGTIVQRNPENAAITYTASFGFSASRYVTAGTAWNDGSVNAYNLLLAAVASAQDLIGPVEGIICRQAHFNAILADAPSLPNSVTMTRSSLVTRIQDDLNQGFRILVDERSVDVFDDGGTAYTRTKLWPSTKVAFLPAGGVVGQTAFAPVVRAMDLASQVGPAAGIDVRGNTVYYEEANNGRQLTVECQMNALPIPDEQKLYVVNVGF